MRFSVSDQILLVCSTSIGGILSAVGGHFLLISSVLAKLFCQVTWLRSRLVHQVSQCQCTNFTHLYNLVGFGDHILLVLGILCPVGDHSLHCRTRSRATCVSTSLRVILLNLIIKECTLSRFSIKFGIVFYQCCA